MRVLYSRFLLFIFFLSAAPALTAAISIAEKKASLLSGGSGDLSQEMQRFLIQVNNELREQRDLLRGYYDEAEELYDEGAEEEEYSELITQIRAVKENIAILENSWRDVAVQNNKDEDYALWHQPDTTLGDLIIDYGSQDYVYLMSSEISSLPVSLNSNIPIPRADWNEMLELILSQNGIGIRQLNPFLRQLYTVEEDNSTIAAITNDRSTLDAYPDEARICFMLTPPPSEVRRVWFFLEKFINPETTHLQMIGRDVLIVASVSEVRELLKLYEFVEANGSDMQYKIVSLRRVDAEGMANILSAIFNQFNEEPEKENGRGDGMGRFRENNSSGGSLKVVTLANVAQAVFLMGASDEIRKAEEIIYQVEREVGEATEKVIYTYISKHTDTEELATILEKVYVMMLQTGVGLKACEDECGTNTDQRVNLVNVEKEFPTPQQLYQDGFYQEGGYIVNPAPVQPGITKQGNPNPNEGRMNFIVDPKTGAIVMVVEAVVLPKLKELIKKLDVPKKMVQIDVLLFEKRAENKTRFGLNVFRLGDKALNVNSSSLTYNDTQQSADLAGVLQFCLSRACSAGAAAYDLAYKFLLAQDDICVNANPSVIAVNQTTATLAINEEISINTGIFEVETVKGVTLKDSYTRAQYGTTIKVTPTIHLHDENSDQFGDPNDYVTLETDITFQTPLASADDRPDVINRQVVNTVRIANGQTVILGGLRRKQTTDLSEKIPYLGELPGIGVLFGDTRTEDKTTEMFICLTPTIIYDPGRDLEVVKCEEVRRRPGDVPSFLCRLVAARERQKNRLLRGYLQMVLGREPDRCYRTSSVYDGR